MVEDDDPDLSPNADADPEVDVDADEVLWDDDSSSSVHVTPGRDVAVDLMTSSTVMVRTCTLGSLHSRSRSRCLTLSTEVGES